MDIQAGIRAVTEGKNLGSEDMVSVMRAIMTGDATQAQIGGFLIGLRMKGETTEEIAAAASVMRELATPVRVDTTHLVDTCGTGGDGSATFNISTASAFVVAGAGGKVAKHGNRSVSSKSGSADVLEAAGVNLDLNPEQVAACIERAGVGFMFAPRHHGAMKHAIGPRREMAVRTVFNLLGPLTNPAGAPNQLIGVFSAEWTEPLAQVLGRLGSRHVLVVHSDDGLDELSVGATNRVAELKDGKVQSLSIDAGDYGLGRHDKSKLLVESPEESLETIRGVLSDNAGAAHDVVCFNAGAAIYVAGLAKDIGEGVDKAKRSISSGAAAKRLDALVEVSNSFA